MSYTPPAYNAVNFTWAGAPAYTPPAYNAVNFTWAPAVSDVIGTGAGVVPVTGAGTGVLAFAGAGNGVMPITGAGVGQFGEVITGDGAGVVPIAGDSAGLAGAAGTGAGVVPVVGAGVGAHGASGAAAGVIAITGAAVALHHRYELRGEVRLSGVLVNRRVRAYLRSSGAMVGEADTVAGKFAIHAGFAAAEHYLIPIDLDADATDWLPPTANRVLSVLAEDAP